jgi:type IV pilus assembly protein PilN
MIKINLLLTRKEKKKVGIRKEFIVLALSIVLLVTFFFVVQWRMNQEIENKMAENAKVKQDNDRYKSLSTELAKLKKEQSFTERRLNKINSLRRGKEIPIRILDEISMGKPERIQLESLKKEASKLGIEGIALDDETVANFMANLRKSTMFKSVDLIVSEQIEQSKLKIKKFSLTCEIIQ